MDDDRRKATTPDWLWWIAVIICMSTFVGINVYVFVQGQG